MMIPSISAALEPFGLILRGGFYPTPEDGLDAAWAALVGNAGSDFWPRFQAGRRDADEPHPLDAWTRRVVEPLAQSLGARARFPFEGPPYLPFQRWAQRADGVFPSPLGLLVHPRFGLWHAYRAVLLFDRPPADKPQPVDAAHPCAACTARPCLAGCPVGAFDGAGYDVPACVGHLAAPAGADCMALGCAARRACPVGAEFRYVPAHAAFHMAHFRRQFG